jgi:2-polyprenyl-3-methyl-5-hydroxy-6-metoxy-1,4-benzoquinol methylase
MTNIQQGMTDTAVRWKDFWNTYPNRFAHTEFLRQVSKTCHGHPITQEQIQIIIDDIIRKLHLQARDHVLDLCCGNGVITSAIAKHCALVRGVDFSKPLIKIAREYHRAPNIRYYCMSVLDITPAVFHPFKNFT